MHPNHALLVERYGIHETVASLRRAQRRRGARQRSRERDRTSITQTFLQDRNRYAKERVSAPGAPRRTASDSDTSGLCTPSPPSFVFGPINTRATSAGMGTMSKARRHDSVSALAHVAKDCGHGPTLNNMTSFVQYNIFCISRSHMKIKTRTQTIGALIL